MLEDFRRGTEEDTRRQREAAEKAARDRAQASLAQLSVSQSPQSSWSNQPQNYPPAPFWQVRITAVEYPHIHNPLLEQLDTGHSQTMDAMSNFLAHVADRMGVIRLSISLPWLCHV